MKPVAKVAPLVFVSGACALVYQVAWTREMRLVFGASTAASAAVLAIFMGGLGAGGVLLGRRADRHADPLMLYARLELGVAALAALTPLLLVGVRWLYVAIAASAGRVAGLGTVTRLALSALVLGPPALLMGGTLPAAARAVARGDDHGRRDVAVLYGVNTLGAVAGAAFATFVLLEMFGTRLMLWLACTTNLLVFLGARTAAQSLPPPRDDAPEPEPESGAHEEGPRSFVLAAAAAVGFAFLLMEIVWYRMLAPVLGGSSYTFGLVLAVALFGLGAGGAARAAWGRDRRAALSAFALTCALEALALAVPFALGDRIAVLALLLRPLGGIGLAGLALGWTVVASIVILPAALVSGWQFPLLVSLLGSGGRRVGHDVSAAYAWNTAGAILGSLGGGFGLLPALGAPGVWRAAAVLLALVGAGAAVIAYGAHRSPLRLILPSLATLAAMGLLFARGPTSAWRHSAIGAGREADVIAKASPRLLRDWVRKKRREVAWEADGVESSVAMTQLDGYAFLVNGKVDGHVRGDAATQVMGGLLGALLHPAAKRSLVIGLGTGSSAGWLAAAPGMERVDVVELEPAVVRVARDSTLINRGVLDDPRVHLTFADAREVLLTTRERYDVIFSEPSNPYRAGVSSLFTQEFYRAVAPRLAEGGLLLQWLQAYEIDGQALHTALATISSVFPFVETWTTGPGDLILVASLTPVPHDLASLRARLDVEPYREALARAWRVTDVEGILAHFVARASLTRKIAEEEGDFLNTDDRTLLEFAFARTAGVAGLVDEEMLQRARELGDDRPEVEGVVDWILVDDQRMAMAVAENRKPTTPPGAGHWQERRSDAFSRYMTHDPVGVVATWQTQPRPPTTITELEMVGESYADMGDVRALPLLEKLRAYEPAESDALLARLHLHKGDLHLATDPVLSAFTRYGDDPWPDPDLMRRTLNEVALPLSKIDPPFARKLWDLLGHPFALHMLESDRLRARVELAVRIDFKGLCVEALAPYEPNAPWGDSLLVRARCYRAAGDPRAVRAEHDFEELVESEGRWLSTGLFSKGN